MHVLHDAVRLIPGCVTLPPHSSGMWSQLRPGLCSRCSPDLPGRIWQTSGDGTAQDSAPRKNSSKGEKEHRTTQVCSGTKPQGPEGRGEWVLRESQAEMRLQVQIRRAISPKPLNDIGAKSYPFRPTSQCSTKYGMKPSPHFYVQLSVLLP